jgi:hypothetical protein
MAKESRSDTDKIIWKIFSGIMKFLWKLFLMLLWGFLRITELILGQCAKWLKGAL